MKLKHESRLDLRLAVIEIGRHVCFMGGDAPDTSGQNEAARVNAEIAKEMWGEYQKVYLPMEREFASEAFNTDTETKRAEQAGLAQADVAGAFANQRDQSQRQLASMGIDPSSGAWANQDTKLRLSEAAAAAGAQNAARRNTDNLAYARKQDAISIGKGMPGTAASSMANSGNQYAQIANAQMQNDANQASGLGNVIGGAAALYGMGMGKADGGYIDKKEQRLAGGGMAGNPRMQQVMTSPNVMPVGGGGMNPAVSAGLNAVQAYKGVKNAASMGKNLANMASDPELALTNLKTSIGLGPSTEAAGLQASGAETFAATAPESITGTALTDAAGTAVADTATTAAAGTAAEATGAATAAAAEGGLSAALASNPVGWMLGAGLLASQLFKADGGKVSRKDLRKGGKVNGPGTETSDSIPATAPDGSYILNAETVKMLGKGLTKSKVPLRVSKNEIAVPPELVRLIGKDKLDQANQAGLQKRYGLSDARRSA